ncbi:MAG: hypothetical protein ISN29_05090 [Gammaproteobacteria bacterium AqS3]|nr:hypothetical protein [Gammaproteobacteria bacterium AqS3]
MIAEIWIGTLIIVLVVGTIGVMELARKHGVKKADRVWFEKTHTITQPIYIPAADLNVVKYKVHSRWRYFEKGQWELVAAVATVDEAMDIARRYDLDDERRIVAVYEDMTEEVVFSCTNTKKEKVIEFDKDANWRSKNTIKED